ncbi:methyltransferase type 11 [Sphingobacterium anhuiense]|uniref:Methyltransferase type 11 n=1 Tax=Sphingobacterium anhuiense TaxID=493780 RepID=A0ABW5YVY7_9SPHI
MVQIFKTNVTNKKEAKLLAVILSNENPEYKINFDLDDCDNILRIENFEIANHKVIFCLERMGYTCEVLF